MFPIRDHNPSERTPYVTYTLIAVNIAIFLWGMVAFPSERELFRFQLEWGMIPARISAGDGYETLITSIFLHGGFMHLAGNMLFLFIFGDNLEDDMGHLPFLVFYMAAGIGADLAQYATAPLSNVPTIGASGAIAGVMGGYLLLYPKAKVDILLIFIIIFKVIPVPAWLMLGLWFGLQLFNGLGADPETGGVAYWAHAGGFVIGLLLCVPLWRRMGATRYWQDTEGRPPHPEATYPFQRTNIPRVPRK